MMKIVCFFGFLALIHYGDALHCYTCSKKTCNSEQIPISNCSNPIVHNHVAGCLTHIFHDKSTNHLEVIKKCVHAQIGPITDVVDYTCNVDEGQELACLICNTDSCNLLNTHENINIRSASTPAVVKSVPNNTKQHSSASHIENSLRFSIFVIIFGIVQSTKVF